MRVNHTVFRAFFLSEVSRRRDADRKLDPRRKRAVSSPN
jgi:hypothetical protein